MPRARAIALSMVGALGCHERFSLDDVPIVGGTDDQRALVRERLAEFEADAGVGRLTLQAVVFDSLDDPIGSFNRRTDRIELSDQLDPSVLALVLRHELCHALDFTEQLVDRPSPLFDGLADGLFDPDAGALALEDAPTARLRRSEALARFCDLGPLSAHGLRDRCPGEPPEAGDVADWLMRHVWQGVGDPGPIGALRAPQASWDAGPRLAPPDNFSVFGGTDPDMLYIAVGTHDLDYTEDFLTRDSAEPWDGPFTGAFSPGHDLPAALPIDLAVGTSTGWPDGPAAANLDIDLYHLGRTRRILASDGARWGVVPACVPSDATLPFSTADLQVWYGWLDGTFVRWALLLDGHTGE